MAVFIVFGILRYFLPEYLSSGLIIKRYSIFHCQLSFDCQGCSIKTLTL